MPCHDSRFTLSVAEKSKPLSYLLPESRYGQSNEMEILTKEPTLGLAHSGNMARDKNVLAFSLGGIST